MLQYKTKIFLNTPIYLCVFFFFFTAKTLRGFPGGSVVKHPPANTGDTSSLPRLGTSPGGGNGNLLQYSCLGNPTGREAWWAAAHGVAKELDTTKKQTSLDTYTPHTDFLIFSCAKLGGNQLTVKFGY